MSNFSPEPLSGFFKARGGAICVLIALLKGMSSIKKKKMLREIFKKGENEEPSLLF